MYILEGMLTWNILCMADKKTFSLSDSAKLNLLDICILHDMNI